MIFELGKFQVMKLFFFVYLFFSCEMNTKINSLQIPSINSNMYNIHFRGFTKRCNKMKVINMINTNNLLKRHHVSFLENCIESPNIRIMINRSMKEKYKYISYPQAKQVLHEHANMIDIYGDKVEDMNVEHVFPQFMFKNDTRKKEMKSDVHNLFLCNTKLNNYRSNFRYVKPSEYLKFSNDTKCHVLDMKGNKVTSSEDIFRHSGYLMAVNSRRKVFVPTEYSRGKIARALAYFAIKYDYLDKLNHVIDLKTMLEWNFNDPVTNDEYLKNVIGYMYQGNLNPFIIDPDLMHLSFLDFVKVDSEMLNERRTIKIDPFYTIDYLIDQLKDSKCKRNKLINVLKRFK